MQIHVLSLMEGARRAHGVAVIIDVYRAYTTAAYALRQGAEKILLVDSKAEALALRAQGVGDYCVGEVGGRKPPEFDFGNSPYELANADVAGRTLIEATSAGTRGAVAAREAHTLYVAALVNAKATAQAILAAAPDNVSIVAMGSRGKIRTDEDEQCALYLCNLLCGRHPDPAAVRSLVLAGWPSAKFERPLAGHFDLRDRDLAVAVDAISFAMRVIRHDGLLIARREDVPIDRMSH